MALGRMQSRRRGIEGKRKREEGKRGKREEGKRMMKIKEEVEG